MSKGCEQSNMGRRNKEDGKGGAQAERAGSQATIRTRVLNEVRSLEEPERAPRLDYLMSNPIKNII